MCAEAEADPLFSFVFACSFLSLCLQVVEAAYQRTKNFERLSFLYLITGNVEKLSKMLHIATLRGDMQGRFHNALYLGNVPERVQVLRESGQLNLAYLTAKAHALDEEADAIVAEMGGEEKLPPSLDALLATAQEEGKLLLPPTPILREANWPLLEVRKGFFDQVEAPDEVAPAGGAADQAAYESSGDEGDEEGEVNLGWGDSGADLDLDIGGDGKKKKKSKTPTAAAAAAAEGDEFKEAGEGGWGGDLDIDLPGGDDNADAGGDGESGTGAGGDYFVMPSSGKNAVSEWANQSTLAADQVAAGAFDQAMHLLHRQIGVVAFEPLRDGFLSIHNAAQAYLPTLALMPPLATPLFRSSEGRESAFPCLAYKLAQVVEPLKLAYKCVTEGKFAAALKEFMSVLHTLPLVVVEKRAEVAEVAELLAICREYVTAIRIEMARKEAEADPLRQLALAAYFTQCKLQTTHLILGLKSAIKAAYTLKNYALTAGFCRRILEICSSTSSPAILAMVNVKQIKGVLQVCEKTNTDEKAVDYPESHFVLCCQSLTPIAKGQPASKCPYCASTFMQQFDDQICNNCQLAKVGMQATGLRVFPE